MHWFIERNNALKRIGLFLFVSFICCNAYATGKTFSVSQGCFPNVTEVRSPSGLFSIISIKNPDDSSEWERIHKNLLYLLNLTNGETRLIREYVAGISVIWSPSGNKAVILDDNKADADCIIVFTDKKTPLDLFDYLSDPSNKEIDSTLERLDFTSFKVKWITDDSLEIVTFATKKSPAQKCQVTMKYFLNQGIKDVKKCIIPDQVEKENTIPTTGTTDVSITSLPASLKTGTEHTFQHGAMIFIHSGTFRMGKKTGYAPFEPDTIETPIHHVKISKSFWIQKYEVTNAQFAAFVDATGYRTDAEKEGYGTGYNIKSGKMEAKIAKLSWHTPGWKTHPNRPVVLVSWNDVQAYIQWLNKQGEGTFRLPSEAEWEYACRAGTVTDYPWGNRIDDGLDMNNQTDSFSKHRIPGITTYLWSHNVLCPVSPPGLFKPNPWGICNMLGNIDEWCQDKYHKDYADAPTDGSAWENAASDERMIRIAFSTSDYYEAMRTSAPSNYRSANLGFRLVRNPE